MRSTWPSSAFPGDHVLESADAALRKGVRALCVISAGFAEVGSEGAERQRQLLALVRAHGARLVGPNCLGIAVPADRAERHLRAARASRRPHRLLVPERRARPRAAREGRRARASASRRSSRSATRQTSRRTTCSSGGRKTTRPTSCSSTSSRSATRTSSRGSPRRVARRKPIARAEGRHAGAGARAASSHTAALAGSDAAVDALFRQRGCPPRTQRSRSSSTSRRCSRTSRCRRAAASPSLTNAGGLGILCADACDAAGLELPRADARDAGSARRRPPGARRASRTRSTCSARRRARRTRQALPHALRDPASTR